MIHPSERVKRTLWEVSYLCKDLWNLALEQRKNRNAWGHVNLYSQKKELPLLKKAYPELKAPASQVLQNVLFDLDASYQMYFTKLKRGDQEVRPPRFKSWKQFMRPQRNVCFLIEETTLKLAYGSKRCDWLEIELPVGAYESVKTVDIIYDKREKKWYACMTYQVAEAPVKTGGEVIYFDPGCQIALTGLKTTGEFVEYDLNPLRELNKSTYALLDELISQRDKKQKGSYHWRRLNEQIKRLFRKIRTRTKTYLQTLAKTILNEHPDVKEFYIGNWKKKETLAATPSVYANRVINRAVQNNNPLEELIGYLTYKGKLRGQLVKRFDERGSTRTCSACDHKPLEGLKPSQRVFECEKCRFRYLRDHHARDVIYYVRTLNFVKRNEPALWRCLSGELPDRSVRVGLNPFSFKPWRRERSLVVS